MTTAGNQESPGFSRGEDVKPTVSASGGEGLLGPPSP